jgi:S1-C subfamily serine protease
MKRTLLEILSGLAVLVLLASFHHQISRLRGQSKEVEGLRALVRDAVARSSASQEEVAAMRQQLLDKLDARLQDLETRVADARAGSEEAARLKQELVQARGEADRFRAEIARDFGRTRELVDAYHEEIRAIDRRATEGIFAAQGELQKLTARVMPESTLLTEEMLAPAVQLNGEDTVGSGTLVYSGANPKTGTVENYVLTSYHVVRNILAESAKVRREGVVVTLYGEGNKREDVHGDMVSHDEPIDAALIKLRTETIYRSVAKVLPQTEACRIKVWDAIYAVGCPLGNDPIPTQGEISSVRNELRGSNYWMINAPTYFGNSGGGVYLAHDRRLIGVFSKIYTHGKGNPVVVPHMGLCTPITLIYEWLDRESLSFVLTQSGPNQTEAAGPAPVK